MFDLRKLVKTGCEEDEEKMLQVCIKKTWKSDECVFCDGEQDTCYGLQVRALIVSAAFRVVIPQSQAVDIQESRVSLMSKRCEEFVLSFFVADFFGCVLTDVYSRFQEASDFRTTTNGRAGGLLARTGSLSDHLSKLQPPSTLLDLVILR
ncbi:hypothetical protein J6590_051674 [Homalodisca vitripennis]|nr:hypothetical protein J6590_051674 [Homalodisca vitripennis]